MIYQHTQIGWAILAAFAAVAVLMVGLMLIRPSLILDIGILVILLAFAIVFGTLTVQVGNGKVRCWFGPGLIRKEFDWVAIDDVSVVRNRWFYGWGIRLTPEGWMFNVSGFDAVQVHLATGKRFRIGTDEPEKLEAAIRQGMEEVDRDV
ncbi:hypothetical protein [Baaleninema sp.]|uniref:hypothetical protein n=1 Tax=Baaleninema sp. TaxID=3101197 RepID=UPI003D0027B0